MKVTLRDLLRVLGTLENSVRPGTQRTTTNLLLSGVALPEEAQAGDIAWLRPGRDLDQFGGTVLLLGEATPEPRVAHGRAYVTFRCKRPREVIGAVIRELFGDQVGRGPIRIHPTARIHESAVLGPHGQGYVWSRGDAPGSGHWENFPQIGGVHVDADVEIGPCSTVMCAAIGMTRVGKGARIGNGVNVGHGAQIGEHALLSAHVTVGGGVTIGPRAILWQNVAVAHGVRIGADAVVGLGSTVIRDVPAGEVWAGNPARRIGQGEGI